MFGFAKTENGHFQNCTFYGNMCVDIDECVSSPCQNNGTCHDGINGYTCECFPGYTGVFCEIGSVTVLLECM